MPRLVNEREPELRNVIIYVPEWDEFLRASYWHWPGLAYFNISSSGYRPHPDDRLAIVTGSILNWFPIFNKNLDGIDGGVLITTPVFKHDETVKEYQGK